MKQQISGHHVSVYTLHEALVAAGSADVDNPFMQDQALEDYFGEQQVVRLAWDPERFNEDLTRLVRDGVQVVIITGKQNE